MCSFLRHCSCLIAVFKALSLARMWKQTCQKVFSSLPNCFSQARMLLKGTLFFFQEIHIKPRILSLLGWRPSLLGWRPSLLGAQRSCQESQSSELFVASFLRICRLIRLVRVMRIFRLKAFKELCSMCHSRVTRKKFNQLCTILALCNLFGTASCL